VLLLLLLLLLLQLPAVHPEWHCVSQPVIKWLAVNPAS
jgi:hypothetical protein